MAKKGVGVHIYGDWDGSGVKKAKQDLSGFQKQAQGFTGAISKSFVGMGAAIGGALALSSVVDFAKGAISAGSDLQESLSKTTAVFGDNASAVVRWSENSATAFGQSKQQALEAAGTFGNLLIAFGSTTDEAQKMSQRMVELAADLASFNNTSVDDALNALRSGLSGETEPLKRFGVAINDARLKAVALEKGLYSGKGTLDVYAKSVAAYELILKDTALAQGDFARTSDGLANQQRILEATFTNLQTALGSGIIDGFGDLGTNGQTVVDAMEALQPALESVGQWIGESGQDYLLLVAQTAALVSELHNLIPALGDTSEEASLTDQALGNLAGVFSLTTGSLSFFSGALQAFQGTVLRKASDALDGTGVSARAVAGELKNMADSASDAADDTMTAEEALKALKDQVNALKGAISDRQAMDDFRKSLRDLDETLEGNKRTFKGMSDSALENREVLRTAFSDAADIVQGMVDRGEISADQFEATFAGLGSDIVDQFVKDGFTRADIRKFLKSEGLWTGEFNKVGDYAKAAGVNIGKDLLSGIKGSLTDPNNLATLRYAGMQAALAAEEGARSKDGADTGSPSKKWKKLGGDLMSGLAIGIKSKNDDLKADAADTMQGILDKATEIVSGWDDKIKDALDANNDAKQAITDWAASTRDTLVSAFDLSAVFEGSYDEEGNFVASKFFGGMDAAIAKFEWYNNVLRKIKESGGSDQLVAFLQSQGVDKGGVWGQSLIDKGLVDYMNQNLAKVTDVADTTAQATVPAFLLAAEENSAALYNQVVKDYGKDGEKRKKLEALMDRLAKALNRTSTITVKTVYEAAGIDGKRAAGGPVSANKAYLVGERGPEVLVMGGQSGTIVPNGDLPMASGGVRGGDGATLGGNSYSITVQAGVGDPRQIGQQVVEVIRRFESANGRVFAAA